MVKVTKLKKRRLYDEDADWTPAKGRLFMMKKWKQDEEEQEEAENEKPKQDISPAPKGRVFKKKKGSEKKQ